MIVYNKVSERPQKVGIEVTVDFSSNGITKTKIFLFADQDDIDTNFTARMDKAIQNFIDGRERDITPTEIVEKLNNYFSSNTTLTRAQAKIFMEDKVIVEGSL